MTTTRVYQDERGNALFLILIAVVLFAALSYAITQSNRGGGNVGRETNQIAGTTITQYSSGIRTGITRMLLRGSSPAELLFNPPAHFSTDTENEVFHPEGGGVGYQLPEENVIAEADIIAEATSNGTPYLTQNWHFLTAKPVKNIGVDGTGDIVAVLSKVKRGICEQLNNQIRGTTDIPVATATDATIIDASTPIAGTGVNNGIDGQPFGCVQASGGGDYYYYHVLAEQ